MFAAGGLLILLAMGYAVTGLLAEDDPDNPQGSAADADMDARDTEDDETPMTEGTDLADLLFGRDDDDAIEASADRPEGGAEHDMLRLGPGDHVTGSADADVFTVAATEDGTAEGTDAEVPQISDFQTGIDRLILEFDGLPEDAPEISFDSDSTPDATTVLANGLPVALLLGVTSMDLSDVEVQMIDSAGPVAETGDADADDGYHGADLMDGGTAADMLQARAAMADQLASAHDAITGGVGHDTIQGGADNDMLVGNEGDDVMLGDAGADEIYGEDGDDRIEGGAGTDFLVGGDGQDSIVGGDDGDLIFGGDGDDLLSGDGGDDYLQGGFGADTLSGGAGNDRLDGTFTAGGSVFATFDQDEGDRLDGGDGDDTILIGAQDIATGGDGADSFVTGSYIETAEVAGHVTDFNPSMDVIEVIFDPDLTPDPMITVEDFADGTGANILFEGQLILSVSGAQGLDPSMIELREVIPDRAA